VNNAVLLSKSKQFIVVVPAAGIGKRMLASCPKQYLHIDNQSILNHTVNRLLSHDKIKKVILAISEEDDFFAQTALADNPNIIQVSGGKERVDSVLNGLKAINNMEWVLVHDAARPCITHDDIDKLIQQCLENDCGGLLGAPVVDTMKLATSNNTHENMHVDETIERSKLWHAFTPQMFKVHELQQAIEQAQAKGLIITDESSAIESMGLPCLLISGRRDNLKITRPEDLVLAEFYLEQQKLEQDKI
jgi:2-C-methyl-D-erythritol 4-phosphate cytidylyltransferase